MFPASYGGHLTWGGGDRDTPARLLAKIETGLRDSGVTVSCCDGEHMSFHGTIRSWLLPSVTGEATGGWVRVDITAQTVTWRLLFNHFVLLVTVLLLLSAPSVVAVAHDEPFWLQLLLLAVVWTWLVGATYLFSMWRFSSFIRRMLREAREPDVMDRGALQVQE